MSEKLYKNATPQGEPNANPNAGQAGQQAGGNDDGVVDVDYEEVKDNHVREAFRGIWRRRLQRLRDFSDIFGDFFGGGASSSGRRRGPAKGQNVVSEIEISFEDAAFGCEREITFSRIETCSTCHGSGAKEGTSPPEPVRTATAPAPCAPSRISWA